MGTFGVDVVSLLQEPGGEVRRAEVGQFVSKTQFPELPPPLLFLALFFLPAFLRQMVKFSELSKPDMIQTLNYLETP